LLNQSNIPISGELLVELFSDYNAEGFLRELRMNSDLRGEINIYPKDDVKSIKITALSPDVAETYKIIDVAKGSKTEAIISIELENDNEDPIVEFKEEPQEEVQEKVKEEVKTAVKKGTVKFKPIYFNLNSSEIKMASIPKLHEVIQYLRDNPRAKVEIIGHADETGAALRNEILSNKRADAVRNYFIKMKIKPNRIKTTGMGSSQPAFKTSDRSLHRFNRRVEFKIYE